MGIFDRFLRPKEEKTNTNLHNNDERSTITLFTGGNNVRLRPLDMITVNTRNGEKTLYRYALQDASIGSTVLETIMTELSPQELEECKNEFGYFARADFGTIQASKSGVALYLGGLSKDEDGKYSPTKDSAIATAVDNMNAKKGITQEVQQDSKTTEYQQAAPSNSVPEKFKTITIPSINGTLIITPQIDKNNHQKCVMYRDRNLNEYINVPQYMVKWESQGACKEIIVNAELDTERLRNDFEYQQFVAQKFLSPERLEKIHNQYHGYAGVVMENSNTGRLDKFTRDVEMISRKKDTEIDR